MTLARSKKGSPPLGLKPASTQFQAILDSLEAVSQLYEQVELRSTEDIGNAAALIRNAERLIVYNETFLACDSAPNVCRAFETFVIGHELGHHLEGHSALILGGEETVNARSERHADAHAARALRALGFTDADVVAGLKLFASKLNNTSDIVQRVNEAIEEFRKTPDTNAEKNQLAVENLALRKQHQSDLGQIGESADRLAALTNRFTIAEAELHARTPWSEDYVVSRPRVNEDYVINSVSMVVMLDDATYDFLKPGTPPSATVEITYVITALADKVLNFDEEFHSSSARIEWLPSSDPSVIAEDLGNIVRADLPIALKRQQRVTLVTRGRFTYAVPFPPNRNTHGFDLTPGEDAWCYPNKSDAIDEVVLTIISSQKLQEPGAKDAHRLGLDGTILETSRPELIQSKAYYAVRQRWRAVPPGVILAVKIARTADGHPETSQRTDGGSP